MTAQTGTTPTKHEPPKPGAAVTPSPNDTPNDTLNAGNKMSTPVDDEETLLWRGTFSAKSMTGWWIATTLLTLVLMVGVAFAPPAMIPVIGVLSVLWLILIGLTLYRKLSQHYEVTSQRLMHRDGIFIRRMDRIELIDIDDVSYQQGPIQALMSVGTLKIVSSDSSHPELIMPGIAEIRNVADLIDDARRIERRKRGLHIESI